MHRCLPVVFALALIAAACGDDGGDETADLDRSASHR